MSQIDSRPMTAWTPGSRGVTSQHNVTKFKVGCVDIDNGTHRPRKQHPPRFDWTALKPAVDLMRLNGWTEVVISEALNVNPGTLLRNLPRGKN